MVASAYDNAMMKQKSLEDLSRKLRRERIKLERNMSGGSGGHESPSTSEKNQAQVQPVASDAKTNNEASDLSTIRVNNDPQDTMMAHNDSFVSQCDAEEKKQDDVDNQHACQPKSMNDESSKNMFPSFASATVSTVQSPETSVLVSPVVHANVVESSAKQTGVSQQPSHAPPRPIPNDKGKFWPSSFRQTKQKYDKSKSSLRKWTPKVSSNDLWLIRQTPNINGSFPDDEVSVYPDTMSVMSVDTQVRSNLITVEEVINEDGRTCYVI